MAEQFDDPDDVVRLVTFREAVRQRPGMYVGSADQRGLRVLTEHLFTWAIRGSFSANARICVTLSEDGTLRVHDDGPGPRDFGLLDSVLWDEPPFSPSIGTPGEPTAAEERWERQYISEIAIVRILADRFTITVAPEGGVNVEFHPDPEIFGDATLDAQALQCRLRELSLLHPRIAFTFTDETSGHSTDSLTAANPS